ncbi:alpha/beta hydrolase [Aggregicoccus sp. 17bor-14]|uniref:alpha/beta fold hydrolase n=1 Tax=Myxococcaceae TaxID=31 RepID=UPI00129C9C3A|nr:MULTISPECIES: alpha/beta hydrolase [Myxococcaceae]MBF5040959.1 alpha/beta hydrolase [Simulacricoccus sp. 17bor-14]MRI86747.1 alpha/beta hydrolase [Aggregicoccus sp. 17bor-14]
MPTRSARHYVLARDGTPLASHIHLGDAPDPSALGARRTVLLTNGIGTTENFWRFIVGALQEDYRVVHWDYRGHGASGVAVSGAYDVPTQVDDLARVTEDAMRRSDGRPPHHVAFSMGVRVLLELFRTRPELVPSMTLIAGAPGIPGSWSRAPLRRGARALTRGVLRALTPLVPVAAPLAQAALASPATYPVGRALGVLQPGAPREDIDTFMQALKRMDPLAYWQTLRGLLEGHASDVLPRVKVPTQIIAAANDRFVPMAELERMRQALPHARWRRIENAGHAGLLEAGPEHAAEVKDFVDGLPA